MRTIPVQLDDELDKILAEVCSAERRNEAEVVGSVLRKYLTAQRLQRALQNPELAEL